MAMKLLETGISASYEGFAAEGESIVRGVQKFRDDVPQPFVCLVASFYFQKRYEDAIAEAKAVLVRFPNCQMVKALLGMSLFHMGYREWQVPLKEVVLDGRDEWAIQLVQSVLETAAASPGKTVADPSMTGRMIFA
jgi:hypothetical protein